MKRKIKSIKSTFFDLDNMVVQNRVHSSKYGPAIVVYKVDQFVKRSLLSSLMLLIYKRYSIIQS